MKKIQLIANERIFWQMDYKTSGVDVEAGRAFVDRIKSSVESTQYVQIWYQLLDNKYELWEPGRVVRSY